MQTIVEDRRLPADIDAQPVVQAAAALKPTVAALPGRDRARAAAAARAGRADARRRLLPPGDPALARRPAGRSADLYARRRAAGRGRRLGRLEPRQQQHRPARHARPAGRGRAGDLSARATYRHRRHRGAGRRAGGAGRGRLPRQRALELRQRLPGEPPGCSAASRSSTAASRAAAPTAARSTGAACSRAPKPRSCRAAGTWPGCAAPAASTGRWRMSSCRSGARWSMPASRSTTSGRWPGITYALPAQAWVGPHHSAVITGIARAGIDALIELAGEKTPRGRTGQAVRQSAGAGRGRAGRCDPERRAHLSQRDDRRTVEHGRRRPGDHARAARPLPAGRGLRRRLRTPGDGPDVPARRQHLVQAREPPGRSAGATCTWSARR